MIGTLLGVAGGVLLALNVGTVLPAIERLFSVQFLDKTVYYINELPSDLQTADVVTIAVHRARARAAGDDLPRLARGEGESGGGAAL